VRADRHTDRDPRADDLAGRRVPRGVELTVDDTAIVDGAEVSRLTSGALSACTGDAIASVVAISTPSLPMA
jgi:hypothetical protein